MRSKPELLGTAWRFRGLCLKTATVIPVSKSMVISRLNDYRPGAPASPLEQLVMAHLKQTMNVVEVSQQYAYRQNQSKADGISTITHQDLSHVENQDTNVKLLFLDFCYYISYSHPTENWWPSKLNLFNVLGPGLSRIVTTQRWLTHKPQRQRTDRECQIWRSDMVVWRQQSHPQCQEGKGECCGFP